MKGLNDYAVLKHYQDTLGSIDLGDGRSVNQYDFYRCWKCKRMMTQEQYEVWQKWAAAQPVENERSVYLHRCGSMKIQPALPVNTEWLMPSVLRYTLKLVLARGLAPWCDKHIRLALPLIEFLVRPKEA